MIKLEIVCEDEKYMPQYANETDACLDIKIKIDHSSRNFYLGAGKYKVFETGIKVKVPENYVMMIFPRSSLGINKKCRLMNSTGIIDSGYRGEIKLGIHNFGDYSVEFEDGERVAQFLIIPRPKIELIQVPYDDNFKLGNRGGGIGSTGK